MGKRMLIKHNLAPDQTDNKPELAFPIIGKWYHGMSERGVGALVKYEGWGEFCDSDGRVVDMGGYQYLAEH